MQGTVHTDLATSLKKMGAPNSFLLIIPNKLIKSIKNPHFFQKNDNFLTVMRGNAAPYAEFCGHIVYSIPKMLKFLVIKAYLESSKNIW